MNAFTHKSSESSLSEVDSINNVRLRRKTPSGHNRSFENIFISNRLGTSTSEWHNSPGSASGSKWDAKRRSKSENELNIQGPIEEMFQSNEFNEKTGELIAKALEEHKKYIFNKTDLENEKDYSTENFTTTEEDSPDNMMMPMPSPQPGVVTDSQGLIVPKKLMNPCLDSIEKQNLHRELLFNQKVGKNVLNQKSELQRALEKQKERQLIMQQQQQQERDPGLKGELSRVIMERQQKIEKKSMNQEEIDSQLNPEYLNARAKLRTRVDAK